MVIKDILITLVIFYFAVEVSTSKRECLKVLQNDFSHCGKSLKLGAPKEQQKGKVKSSKNVDACIHEDICNKTFHVVKIDYEPISVGMLTNIKNMISDCCGSCAGMKVIKTLKNSSELSNDTFSHADIVFPVFSFTNTKQMYGYWYIPIVDVPYGYHFQRITSPKDAMDNMLRDLGNLWSMLVICLVFAISAGFLIWVLDTKENKEDFPRDILIGWFEGFWWSFISMTTVGYGDKAPKSRIARLFSIGWILIGITIFSMLTASLSTIITSAESPPSSDLTGKKVGVLQYRTYDATVAAKHGGRVRIVSYDNVTHGINKLLDLLFSDEKSIDGFLIDKYAYMFHCEKHGHKFKNTVRNGKSLTDKYSFGALVRSESDYNYLRKYIENNWFYFDTCREIGFNEISTRLESNQNTIVFSVNSGLFRPILIGFGSVILALLFIGLLFRFVKQILAKKSKTTEIEMN